MDKEKKDKTPTQLGKAAVESCGREDMPAPKRRKEARTAEIESEDERLGEKYYSEVAENSKMIKW